MEPQPTLDNPATAALERLVFTTIEDAALHFRAALVGRPVEEFHVVLLDGDRALIRHEIVAQGSPREVVVHPRDVFSPAVRERAAAVLVAHNHPSGDPEPSPEDLVLTERLVMSGGILGITLVDHVIIGAGDSYVSLAERGLIRPRPRQRLVSRRRRLPR